MAKLTVLIIVALAAIQVLPSNASKKNAKGFTLSINFEKTPSPWSQPSPSNGEDSRKVRHKRSIDDSNIPTQIPSPLQELKLASSASLDRPDERARRPGSPFWQWLQTIRPQLQPQTPPTNQRNKRHIPASLTDAGKHGKHDDKKGGQGPQQASIFGGQNAQVGQAAQPQASAKVPQASAHGAHGALGHSAFNQGSLGQYGTPQNAQHHAQAFGNPGKSLGHSQGAMAQYGQPQSQAGSHNIFGQSPQLGGNQANPLSQYGAQPQSQHSSLNQHSLNQFGASQGGLYGQPQSSLYGQGGLSSAYGGSLAQYGQPSAHSAMHQHQAIPTSMHSLTPQQQAQMFALAQQPAFGHSSHQAQPTQVFGQISSAQGYGSFQQFPSSSARQVQPHGIAMGAVPAHGQSRPVAMHAIAVPAHAQHSAAMGSYGFTKLG